MGNISLEERLELYEASPVVIYTCKPYGDFAATFISPGISAQLGWEASDFLNDPSFWALNIHPDDKERVFAGLSILFEEDHYCHEYRFQHKDGSYRWMNDDLRLDRDESGNPVKMVGHWTDITAKHRAEQALIDSETRYRQLAELSPDGMLVHVDGEIVFANDSLARILAYPSPEDLLGKQAIDLLAPEYRASMEQRRDKVTKGETSAVAQTEFVRSDGSRVPVERSASQISWQGNPAIVVLFRDISERVEAERVVTESRDQLRLVTDNLPVAITYIDAEQRYRFANKTASEWHRRPVEEIIGRAASEIHGQEYEKLRSRIENTLAGEQLTYTESITYSDGVTRTTRATFVPHSGPAGKVDGLFSLVEDITEIKQAEEAARESEARLRAIADHSPSAIFLKGTEGRFITANQVWHDTYNPTGEDITGKTVHDFVPSDAAAGAVAVDAKILATGEPVVEEQYLPSADGETQYVLSTKFPVRDNDGNIVAIGGVNTDITERVVAEQALRESEARFRGVVENLPASLSLKDLEGRFQFVNPRFTEWFGLQPESVIGRTSHDVSPNYNTELATSLDRKVMETGQTHEVDRDVPFSDGTLHSLALTKFPVTDSDDKIIGIGTINTDVTERKRAERAVVERSDQLRLVTDNLPVLITYIDAQQCYRFVNKTSSEWFARPVEEIVGRTVSEIFGQEFEKIRTGVNSSLAGERMTYVESVTYPDGVTRTVRATHVPHFGADGSSDGYFSLVEDITEIKQAEETLRQAQKMEAVGQLTGGVAHDFNNLLAVILGNTELLLDEIGDHSRLASIDHAATRGAELTERLLAFSRQQALAPQSIDLTELISSLQDLLHRTLGEPVKMLTHVSEEIWPVLADPGQLENALLNLAINARDAMPGGGILEIRCSNIKLQEGDLRVSNEMAAGDYVQIAVRDTGTGMPEGVLEHVFEPFYTTKGVGEGSGLGLSMVYGFARQSGGNVTIESEPGTGTEIKLFLPRSEVTTMTDELLQGKDRKRGQGEVILVLEDDPDVRSFAVAALVGLGYQVHEAADAAAAIQVLDDEAEKLDLLLSDVVLPGGVSGPELAANAKDLFPDLKLVFMSGYAADLYTDDKVPGFDETLLTKPFRLAELAKVIHDTLAA